MWDLKPDAPAEIRGPYKPIATNVPGTFVGEHCPLSPKIADKFTILRTHSHNDNGHTTGYHYCMTGYKPTSPTASAGGVPNNVLYPVARLDRLARAGAARQHAAATSTCRDPMDVGRAGLLRRGARAVRDRDRSGAARLRGQGPAPRAGRHRRAAASGGASCSERSRSRTASRSRPAGAMSTYYEKAYDLITSPDARKAFDIKAESRQDCASATATRRSASVHCWPAGWSRPGAGSSASTTAAGTRTSRCSRA